MVLLWGKTRHSGAKERRERVGREREGGGRGEGERVREYGESMKRERVRKREQ